MKYVRIENRVYKLTDNLIIKGNQLYEKEFSSSYFDTEEVYLRDVFLGKIIKQSNNLTELCDRIVMVPPKGKGEPCTLNTGFLEDEIWRLHAKVEIKQGYKYYLSIWNSEYDLIKVAKIKSDLKVKLCLN